MKNKLFSLFSVLLILAGLTLIFLPNLSSRVIEKQTEDSVLVVEEVPGETLQAIMPVTKMLCLGI